MQNNIFLLGIISIFIFSACTPDNDENKWQIKSLSNIVKDERHKAITKNHDKTIYGTWHSSSNQTLIFSDDGIWQYHQKPATDIGSNHINGNSFTMSNNVLRIYRKDGEIITGKYEFNGQNTLITTDFSDNRFNGTWIKK
ncbi:MAG: hypothetical protein J1G30_07360 [Spirochaetales bacterium]|nr:hypothetical protein [Spirochaetales bacterium]